ncbi:glycosyltransferase family protein [Aureliella helgolandensis]|uniref:Glycosyl transferases group 1 n=1 Tax=Aureliella helgolandensis TaxID=2527968 RepID=A0A518GA06_9BACT|nr:glycosyltransferase family 4 protein [Aureliella helgolandensis]QDV25412.1 hypothetical protein Q31a_37380 [Aureliella helgolandensis]
MNLFFFGWPSEYGGADTKAAHLLQLLAPHLSITVIPNSSLSLQEKCWTDKFDQWGIAYRSLESLPQQLEGTALALCNAHFFTGGIYSIARRRGLRVVWSSEMMWHHRHEVELIQAGAIDRLLYVSEVQRTCLNYESFCNVPTRMVGNYISPQAFPFVPRKVDGSITIGRLSRADLDKYPEDFPVFYEALQIPGAQFRVMAWSPALQEKYRWHHFDERWTLLEPNALAAGDFLQSLDLFIYTLGHHFVESWGRSTLEAMLTGAIPLVPHGHNFDHLIEHGVTGFQCSDFREFQTYAMELADNPMARQQMSHACRERAEQLNDAVTHLEIWLEALDV